MEKITEIKSGKNKSGFFFSLDSFMGLILFILTLTLVYSFFIASHSLQQEFFISEDFLNVFTNVRVGDLDTARYPGIQCLISNKKIDDTSLSIIDETSILYDKDILNEPDTIYTKYFLTDLTNQNPSSTVTPIPTDLTSPPCSELPKDKGLIPVQYDIDVLVDLNNPDLSVFGKTGSDKSASIITRQRLVSRPSETTTTPPT